MSQVKKEKKEAIQVHQVEKKEQVDERDLVSVSSQSLVEVDECEEGEKAGSDPIEFPAARRGRKVRTYLSKEKVVHMNRLFSDYSQQLSEGDTRKVTLREIARELNLGYSTILHRFRQFRTQNRFRAEDLSSVVAKKRKYRKSFVIEDLIRKSLLQSGKTFYTASELGVYILQKYGMKFSRSILSRHLDDMGFSGKKEKEDSFREVRALYAEILMPLLRNNQQLIYVDELTCCLEGNECDENNSVSVMTVVTSYGLLYYKLLQGFYTRQVFFNSLEEFVLGLKKEEACHALMGQNHDMHFVMDMNRIHRDNSNLEPGFKQLMIDENIAIYFIPPSSPDLNPNEDVFAQIIQQLGERKVASLQELWMGLEEVMESLKKEEMGPIFDRINAKIASDHKETD